MILRKIPHFIEIERKQLCTCLGIKSSLNSGIRCLPVTGVENTFLRGMQSSESSFIVTSTVSSTEDGSEITNHKSSESGQASIGGSVFAMFHLDYLSCFLTVLATILLATKILDRTTCRNCQQLDRLCNWIANVTAWLYSSEPVLHLRIRVQHAIVAQGTNTHKIEITRSAFGRLGCSKPGAARRSCGSGQQFERPCCKTSL